jgi:hypothetical protein
MGDSSASRRSSTPLPEIVGAVPRLEIVDVAHGLRKSRAGKSFDIVRTAPYNPTDQSV